MFLYHILYIVRLCGRGSPKDGGRFTSAALKDLRARYEEMVVPMREGRAEAAALERRLAYLVHESYGLTSE